MKKERPKKRVVEVGGGYAEIGDIVRADVFVDEKGHNYMVPIYAVDMACSKPLPDKYLHKNDAPYAEWPSAKDDGLTFRFSLYKDELVSLDGKMYYVAYVRETGSDSREKCGWIAVSKWARKWRWRTGGQN